MKNIKGFVSVRIVVIIFIIALCLLGAGYFATAKYQDYKTQKAEQEKMSQEKERQTQLQLEEQQKALEEAKTEIEKLSSQSADTQKQQQDLTKQVQSQKVTQSTDLSISASEISKYLSGVMEISCGDSSGSISLWRFSDGIMPSYAGVTNAHVIEGVSGNCLLFPGTDNEEKIMASANSGVVSQWNSFADVAVLPIGTPFKPLDDCTGTNCTETLSKDKLNYSISTLPKCSTKLPVGSPVVTVGFPAFSTQNNEYNGIVATASHQITSNGIISGYNNQDYSGNALPHNNYYVSAKIDSGNSGGIAFSKTSSGLCILGIPTWLQIGNYEASGVVQNIHNVMYQK